MCYMHSETEIYECIWVYTILLFRVPPGGIGYARTWSLLPSPSWCQLSLCRLCHGRQEGSGWYVGLISESVVVCISVPTGLVHRALGYVCQCTYVHAELAWLCSERLGSASDHLQHMKGITECV